jgi:type I restriction enzyme, S subunit
VIDGLMPYPTYKDACAPWLGDVPEQWGVLRQRNTVTMLVSNIDKLTVEGELPVRLCNYVDVYKNDRITASLSFMHATATTDEVERFRLQFGDVLITKDSESWTDIGVPALVEYTAPDLVCGYHLAILRPREGVLDGGYLLRALQSQGVAVQFRMSANGVTRYGLSHDAIKSVLLPIPPLPEQVGIVRFLDHADRRIRRYIAAKKKLIVLLNEQKQAIIHRAVTRGLDQGVRLKPSGIEWLGNVPEHWEVSRLRHLIRGRLTYGANAAAEYSNPAWPRYLRITDFASGGTLRAETFRSLPPDIALDYMVEPGDLLFARSGATVGKAFLVAANTGVACHAGYLIRARPNPWVIDPEFLFAFTQSAAFARWKDSTFVIATIQNIGADKYADLRVPVPPLSEQAAIVRFLGEAAAGLDTVIRRAQAEISLLGEYRTRLIADLVTGKLDVSEAAAQLPDEVEEPEPLDDADASPEGDRSEVDEDLDAASVEGEA